MVESTNDLARSWVETGEAPLPFCLRADRQTRGRGRGTNRWWSDEGSLMFTLAIDPRAHGLRPEHEPRMSLASAVGLIDAIESLDLRLTYPLAIRWPNDIEAGDRKLGGILPERVETSRGRFLLIGIGLNLTTRFDMAPDDVRPMAVALTDLMRADAGRLDPANLLQAFLNHLATTFDQLAR